MLALPAKDTVMKKLENVKQIKATVDLYWIVPTSLRLSINSMFLSDQVILHILLGKEYLTSLWGIFVNTGKPVFRLEGNVGHLTPTG